MTDETVTPFGRREVDQRLPERVDQLERLVGGVSVPALSGRYEANEALVSEFRSRLERVSTRVEKVVEFAAKPNEAVEATAKRAEELYGATLVATARSDQLHEGLLTQIADLRKDSLEAMVLLGKALAIRGGVLVVGAVIAAALIGILAVDVYELQSVSEQQRPGLDMGKRN